jgi:hydroxyethylthiazole kinase
MLDHDSMLWDKVLPILHAVHHTKPLVLHLTNYVTMDLVANGLLAIGSAPLMSMCTQELEELIMLSRAVVINLGTLNTAFIKQCHHAVQCAKHYQKYVILDPVGAGASTLRTQTARALLPYAAVVKGNASEILALEKDHASTLGVESTHTMDVAQQTAITLAQQHACTVVISGPEDYITNGQHNCLLTGGSPLMARITGMGCLLTSMIAAFHAVHANAFEAAQCAVASMNRCGQMVTESSPGSYRTAFIDALYQLTS